MITSFHLYSMGAPPGRRMTPLVQKTTLVFHLPEEEIIFFEIWLTLFSAQGKLSGSFGQHKNRVSFDEHKWKNI